MTAERPQEWHADETALQAFAGGRVGSAVGASVEAHLLRCQPCRDRVTDLTPREPLDAVWAAIRGSVEAPAPGLAARLLGRFGVSRETATLLAAVPAFRSAWLLGTAACLAFVALASFYSGGLGSALFLLVAPLVPVLGTAGAYGRDADPAHELTVVSPYSGAKLILLRTLGVVSTCVPLAIGVGLLLTGPVWLSVAWLGPALAGVLIALALASMMDALFASACVAVVWATIVTVVSLDADAADLVRADVQPVFVGLALIAALVVVLRRRSFELLESRS